MHRASRALLVALLSLALAPAAAQAATVTVTTTGDDDTCARDGGACGTIAGAVAVAGAGDTVRVGAGTFAASGVRVTERLNWRGVRAGVDARTRTGIETVITDPSGLIGNDDGLLVFTATSDGSTVDGFTFTGNRGTGNFVGAGLITLDGSGGFTIANNILSENSFGLYMSSSGARTTITHNLFRENNEPAPGARRGIYSELAKDVLVTENAFVGNVGASVIHSVRAGGGEDVTFDANTVTGGSGFTFADIAGLNVTDNTITGGGGSAITLGGDGLRDVDVLRNLITGMATAGVRFTNFGPAGEQTRDVTIAENTLAESSEGSGVWVGDAGAQDTVIVARNRIVDNAGAGLINEDGNAGVNAQRNWWGCNTGPGTSGCDSVISPDGVNPDFTPWLTLSLSADPAEVEAGASASLLARLANLSTGGLAGGDFFNSARAAFSSTPSGTFNPEVAALPPNDLSEDSAFTAGARPTRFAVTVDHETVTINNSDQPAPDVDPDITPTDPTLRPGQKVAIIIELVNRGNRVARRLRACLRVSRKLDVSGRLCREIARLRPGQTRVLRLVVRAKQSACRGTLAYRLRLEVAGQPPIVSRALGRLLAGLCGPPDPCPTVARALPGAAGSGIADRPRGRRVRAHAAC